MCDYVVAFFGFYSKQLAHKLILGLIAARLMDGHEIRPHVFGSFAVGSMIFLHVTKAVVYDFLCISIIVAPIALSDRVKMFVRAWKRT